MASCCKGSLKGGAGGISVPFHLSSTSCARRHPAIGRLLSLTQPIVFLISPLPYTSCSLRSCHKLCLCSLALYLTSPSLHWAFPPPILSLLSILSGFTFTGGQESLQRTDLRLFFSALTVPWLKLS